MLCHLDKGLRKSHVVPEFLYSSLYSNKEKRIYSVPLDGRSKLKVLQQGLKELLLCDECECQLSRYEKYAHQIIYVGGNSERIVTDSPEFFVVAGIEYPQLKLFLMSLLWRASVSKLEFFARVTLGPYEEQLRRMLLAEEPGPAELFGCQITAVELDRELLEVIRMPDKVHLDGHTSYRFLIAGFMYVYTVSKHIHQFPGTGFFLTDCGSLFVHKSNAREMKFLIREMPLFNKGGMDMLHMERRRQEKKRRKK